MKWVWTTKDGRELELKDIEDNHLLNIQKMLQRIKEEDGTCVRGNIFGDEIDAWEEDIWGYEEEEDLRIINEEIKRREVK